MTLYSFAFWALYLALWYGRMTPAIFNERTRANIEIEKILLALPVVIGPVACVTSNPLLLEYDLRLFLC